MFHELSSRDREGGRATMPHRVVLKDERRTLNIQPRQGVVSFQPFALVPMLRVGTTDRALCAHPQMGSFPGTLSRTRSVRYSWFQRRALEPEKLSAYGPMILDSLLFFPCALRLAPCTLPLFNIRFTKSNGYRTNYSSCQRDPACL